MLLAMGRRGGPDLGFDGTATPISAAAAARANSGAERATMPPSPRRPSGSGPFSWPCAVRRQNPACATGRAPVCRSWFGRGGRVRRRPPFVKSSWQTYFISTVAPASSSCFLIFSASSLLTPSLTGFGAASTRSLASFRPRLVIARTSLITLIFFSPIAARITSNSVCSTSRFGRRRRRAGRRHRDRRRCRNAPFFFEHFRQLSCFEDAQGRQLIDQTCQIRHFYS